LPVTQTMSAPMLSGAPKRKLSHEDYTVGWICTLEKESLPATPVLDEEHEELQNDSKDNNSYSLGCMGEHNVVIPLLPFGACGQISAATVSTDMLRSYKSIRFGLMVGIGVGISSEEYQTRLGDVVVSTCRAVDGNPRIRGLPHAGTASRCLGVSSLGYEGGRCFVMTRAWIEIEETMRSGILSIVASLLYRPYTQQATIPRKYTDGPCLLLGIATRETHQTGYRNMASLGS
jgi:hypothetical protein